MEHIIKPFYVSSVLIICGNISFIHYVSKEHNNMWLDMVESLMKSFVKVPENIVHPYLRNLKKWHNITIYLIFKAFHLPWAQTFIVITYILYTFMPCTALQMIMQMEKG